LQTNVYIDGFNLYYGALKDRPDCKWLDLRALSEALLPDGFALQRIYYYTARVGSHDTDPGQPQRQDFYLKALRGHDAPFRYKLGEFRTETKRLPVVGGDEGELATVRVTHEKGSDVNLAIQLVADACDDEMEAALVITDDFDQVGALEMVRDECGIQLIVASPRCSLALGSHVRAAYRKSIREDLLRRCQLPEMVVDDEGHEVFRPPSWR
jgi:hypothetical protein